MEMECAGRDDDLVELMPGNGVVPFKVSVAVANQMRVLKNMIEGEFRIS